MSADHHVKMSGLPPRRPYGERLFLVMHERWIYGLILGCLGLGWFVDRLNPFQVYDPAGRYLAAPLIGFGALALGGLVVTLIAALRR